MLPDTVTGHYTNSLFYEIGAFNEGCTLNKYLINEKEFSLIWKQ
jgi:hypothetical protein